MRFLVDAQFGEWAVPRQARLGEPGAGKRQGLFAQNRHVRLRRPSTTRTISIRSIGPSSVSGCVSKRMIYGPSTSIRVLGRMSGRRGPRRGCSAKCSIRAPMARTTRVAAAGLSAAIVNQISSRSVPPQAILKPASLRNRFLEPRFRRGDRLLDIERLRWTAGLTFVP